MRLLEQLIEEEVMHDASADDFMHSMDDIHNHTYEDLNHTTSDGHEHSYSDFNHTHEDGHSHAAHEANAHHGHHIADEVLIVYFIAIGLLIGALLREVNKKIKLPYTPMLLIAGMIIGGWREYFGTLSEGTALI